MLYGHLYESQERSQSLGMKSQRMEIRTSPEEARAIAKTAKAQGYANSSAFIRSVLRDEISGRQELTEAEQRIAGSFDRLMSEVTRLSRQQQALFALVDTFAKTFLTC